MDLQRGNHIWSTLLGFYDEMTSSVDVVYLDIHRTFTTDFHPDILIEKLMRCGQ